MVLLAIICIAAVHLFVPAVGQHVTVTTPVGDILGFETGVTIEGKQHKVRKFLGIPYAESTAGARRFQKPVPKAPFSSLFPALKMGDVCYQVETPYFRTGPTKFSEDCLLLNIYVPADSKPLDLPVMVFIHGGGFTKGSSNFYVPATLSAYGQVIVVTMNYRLSAFGFLSTGDKNAPGNFGLWDQHLAIRWVHNNIRSFGGNSDLITIFGQSAGSASVVFQALYPSNKGLFQRVIAESGSVTSAWANSNNPTENAERFARSLGCSQSDWQGAVNCLRSKSIDDIKATINSPEIANLPWTPVMDGDFVVEDTYLIFNGTDRLGKVRDMFGSIDLIIGSNKLDTIDVPTWMKLLNESDMNKIHVSKDDFNNKIVPEYVKDYFHMKHSTDILNQAVIFDYTDWEKPDNDDIRRETLLYLAADVFFTIPGLQTAYAHARYSNRTTYVYEFDAAPTINYPNLIPTWVSELNKAFHGTEVGYVFGFDPEMKFYTSGNLTAEQVIVRNTMMTAWTNFARSGNPNMPEDVRQYMHTYWPQFDPQSQTAFIITTNLGPDSIHLQYKAKEFQLWTVFLPEILKQTTCPSDDKPSSNFPDLVG